MTAYEKLLVKAENFGVIVHEVDFETNKECGFYCDNKIVINSRLTENQKHGVLAEELGHHLTSSGIILDQTNLFNRRQEVIARNRSYELTFSIDKLIKSFESGAIYSDEIADFIGVTSQYLHEAIYYYKTTYGSKITHGEYTIVFEPTLLIYKEDYEVIY